MATKVTPKTAIEDLICQKDWDCQTAIAVAKAESGLNCKALNKNNNHTIDSGIFQVNSVHKQKYQGKDILDCQTNIDIAYQIYKAQGWSPWVTWQKGKHLAFMKN